MNINLKNKQVQIIAECGLAHEGSISEAKRFIKLVKKNGADIVKFQTHIAEKESTYDEKFRVKMSKRYKNRFDYWKKTSFSKSQWKELITFAKKEKILFLSSVFSVDAVDLLYSLGQRVFKIGSGEFFSKNILDRIIKLKGSMIISTGMSFNHEITSQIKYLKGKKAKFVIMQCTSSYPSDFSNVNIHLIDYFKKKYKCLVGYSDHTGDIVAPILAIIKKISFLECHVQDKVRPSNPDSTSSISLSGLNFLCEFKKKFYESENNFNIKNKDKVAKLLFKNRILFRKSLALKKNKKKGELITLSNLTMKKPGNGLNYEDINKVLGKKLKNNKSCLRLLKLSDIEK
jgi:N,N'-diacetyllegionaminate synthase